MKGQGRTQETQERNNDDQVSGGFGFAVGHAI